MKKVIFLSFFVFLLTASKLAADWNAYRGNDSRTGNDNSQFLDPAGLQHMWSSQVSAAGFNSSQPVIAGNYAYAGTQDGRIIKVDLLNGTVGTSYFQTNGPVMVVNVKQNKIKNLK